MKKYLYLAAAITVMAGCTSDNLVDGPNTAQTGESGAIVFGSTFQGMTRANYVGADAAEKLNKHFTVGGFKGDGTAYTSTSLQTGTVFDNYNVKLTVNTAATTESNTSDWEYVGESFLPISNLYVDEATNLQTIKYWDYTATQYDFVAYSTGDATEIVSGTPSAGQVLISKINAEKLTTEAYTLKGAADDLQKCYIADLVTAYKTGASMTPAQPKFKDEVKLTFRSLASKVRMAIYETVPGYSVKDVKFYTAEASTQPITEPTTATTATLFTTGTEDKDNFYTSGTYTVYFPTIGSDNVGKSDYNKAHVSFVADASGKVSKKTFAGLNYAGVEYKEKTGTQFLGRTSALASFAGSATNNYYQIAMPNEEGTVLQLRIDYTLESIDGSGEEIKVHGATAYVPAIYAAWKPNYAYTYIFKISDNTNGWTSTLDTDPAGLYPITFDAVVAETEDYTQSTITNVASPSITTYQKSHVYTDSEYDANKGEIYVQVMSNEGATPALKNDLDTKGKLYLVTDRTGKTITEAEVMDALNINVSSTGTPLVVTGRNGWVLTDATTTASVDATITAVPGPDGNDIDVDTKTAAKFTPVAGKTYAYVYDATPTPAPDASYYYSAEKSTSGPSDWTTANTWYKDPNGAEAVAEEDWAADKVFYKKYTNHNKVYGVKVIKVKA